MAVFSKKSVDRVLAATRRERKYTILVVDDEENIVRNLADPLSAEYNVLTAFDGESALELVRRQTEPEPVQVIIADQRMPRLTGVEFMEKTLPILPRAKRIILTGYSDINAVINAINRAQVYRFIMKPWDPDKMMKTIRLALETYEAEATQTAPLEDIVGNHPKLRACIDLVRQVADTKAPVLISGETGTGKELFVRALFRQSTRHRKPMVTVHCAALPETLLESELFGHKKGAFTGADSDRAGRLAQAHGGTLFIDEVAEIPPRVQAKLLRFFQFGEIQRLGMDTVDKVDVRIVSATHRDIPKMIGEGAFREDLFYRLKVVEIILPPLRERADDIAPLAQAFLKKYWHRDDQPVLSEETLMIHQGYSFPGNVRELAHIIERACLLAKGREITPNLLPPEVLKHYVEQGGAPQPFVFESLTNEVLKNARLKACKGASEKVERFFLEQLMQYHDDVAEAARQSGLHRTYLHRLLTKHGLRER